MNIGATTAFWSVILGQQGVLGTALDTGLEVTAATADDFLEAQRQLMAGLEETSTPQDQLRALAQAAIQLKEVVSGGRQQPPRVKEVLRALDDRLGKIDPYLYSAGVHRAKQNHGFGLAARARLFGTREAAIQTARETLTPLPPEEAKPTLNPNLYRRLEELELSVRAHNCLAAAGIQYVGELVQRTEAELRRIRSCGKKSRKEIKEILAELGLELGMKLEGFSVKDAV